MTKRLRVEVFSDIACPWCYVGKRRLEAALAGFSRREAVSVRWRAFELDPSAPAVLPGDVSYAARLARKYGTSVPDAEGMIRRMTEVAANDGLEFRFDRIRPGNTFDAHRLIHLAAERGAEDAVKERFLRAYMSEGEALGDRETLVRLAGEAGLDPEEARKVLEGDAFAREVRQDEEEARSLGIRGVPFFVLGGRYGVSGAQPAELLLGALEEAFAALGDDGGDASEAYAEGAACGPEGC